VTFTAGWRAANNSEANRIFTGSQTTASGIATEVSNEVTGDLYISQANQDIWRYETNVWVVRNNAAFIAATKRTIHSAALASPPTSLAVNDFWLTTDTNQLYIALSHPSDAITAGPPAEWTLKDDADAINNATTTIKGGLINTQRIKLLKGGGLAKTASTNVMQNEVGTKRTPVSTLRRLDEPSNIDDEETTFAIDGFSPGDLTIYAGDIIRIGLSSGEDMYVETGSSTELTVIRGYNDTTAASAVNNTLIYKYMADDEATHKAGLTDPHIIMDNRGIVGYSDAYTPQFSLSAVTGIASLDGSPIPASFGLQDSATTTIATIQGGTDWADIISNAGFPASLSDINNTEGVKLSGISTGAQVNPVDLAALDSTANTKLSGISSGATVGLGGVAISSASLIDPRILGQSVLSAATVFTGQMAVGGSTAIYTAGTLNYVTIENQVSHASGRMCRINMSGNLDATETDIVVDGAPSTGIPEGMLLEIGTGTNREVVRVKVGISGSSGTLIVVRGQFTGVSRGDPDYLESTNTTALNGIGTTHSNDDYLFNILLQKATIGGNSPAAWLDNHIGGIFSYTYNSVKYTGAVIARTDSTTFTIIRGAIADPPFITISGDIQTSYKLTHIAGARVEMSPVGIRGFNSSDAAQFEIRASDGTGVFGDGKIVMNENGLIMTDGGYIRSAGKEYDSETPGFWLGYDTDAYKFEIGETDGNYMQWTGSALNIKGGFTIGDTEEILTRAAWHRSASTYAQTTPPVNGSPSGTTFDLTLIDGKRPNEGDIWIDTNDKNNIYRLQQKAIVNDGSGTGTGGTLTVDNLTSFPIANGDIIFIEAENILVDSGGGTESLGVSRGQHGTTAVNHDDNEPIFGWADIRDTDIAVGVEGQQLAVTKNRTFRTTSETPTTPTSVLAGDIWINEYNDVIRISTVPNSSNLSHWRLRDDASAINNATTTIEGGLINTQRIKLVKGGGLTNALETNAFTDPSGSAISPIYTGREVTGGGFAIDVTTFGVASPTGTDLQIYAGDTIRIETATNDTFEDMYVLSGSTTSLTVIRKWNSTNSGNLNIPNTKAIYKYNISQAGITSPHIIMDNYGVAGYSDAYTPQFSLSSETGKAMAGGGGVILDTTGVNIGTAGGVGGGSGYISFHYDAAIPFFQTAATASLRAFDNTSLIWATPTTTTMMNWGAMHLQNIASLSSNGAAGRAIKLPTSIPSNGDVLKWVSSNGGDGSLDTPYILTWADDNESSGHPSINEGTDVSVTSDTFVNLLTIDDDGHVTDTGTGTPVHTGEANEYSFKTIDINNADSTSYTWGTDNVVADSKTDTLNLIQGLGIEIRSRGTTNEMIRISAPTSSKVARGMYTGEADQYGQTEDTGLTQISHLILYEYKLIPTDDETNRKSGQGKVFEAFAELHSFGNISSSMAANASNRAVYRAKDEKWYGGRCRLNYPTNGEFKVYFEGFYYDDSDTYMPCEDGIGYLWIAYGI